MLSALSKFFKYFIELVNQSIGLQLVVNLFLKIGITSWVHIFNYTSIIQFAQALSRSQSIKRYVKLVTEALASVIGFKRRD